MLIDIIIVILFISALFRGREIGFVRQALSTIGFVAGLLIGALIEPHVIGLAHTTLSRSLLTLFVTLGFGIILLSVGEYVGILLKDRLQTRLPKIDLADIYAGALAGGLTLLIVVWLLAPVLTTLPFLSLQKAVKTSYIASKLTGALPPAPNVIADLGHLIDPNGFPQVFRGLEPTPPSNISAPNLGPLQPAINADKASVVKIEGHGCGGVVEGSGWVAGPGIIATNAHVIAGVKNPVIIDTNGEHQATPIWFDPNLDFAVLRVNDLAGGTLSINKSHIAKGTASAVLGYPGNGGFSAQPAAIMDEFIANGRNIYNQGNTQRDVFELRAKIIPGNSGGPLVDKNGEVIGIVFAESTTYKHVGYALTMSQVVGGLNQAEAQNQATSTGSCAE